MKSERPVKLKCCIRMQRHKSSLLYLWTRKDKTEHPRPRFGEVNDTRWSQEGDVSARLRIIKEGFSTALFGFWLNDSAFRPFFGERAICLKP